MPEPVMTEQTVSTAEDRTAASRDRYLARQVVALERIADALDASPPGRRPVLERIAGALERMAPVSVTSEETELFLSPDTLTAEPPRHAAPGDGRCKGAADRDAARGLAGGAEGGRLMRWKKQDVRQWHRCFAWWPVRMSDGTRVWLESYERRVPDRFDDEECMLHMLAFRDFPWERRLPEEREVAA